MTQDGIYVKYVGCLYHMVVLHFPVICRELGISIDLCTIICNCWKPIDNTEVCNLSCNEEAVDDKSRKAGRLVPHYTTS